MKKAILLLCLILQTIMVSAQYNNENSFMRRIIIGYELRSDGYYHKVTDVLVDNIDHVEAAYAYDKKSQDLYVKTATSNCVVTLNKEYANIVKSNKRIPQLKDGEIDFRVMSINSELEEKFNLYNARRKAHLEDSIAKVRADSIEQARLDSLRKAKEAEEIAEYGATHEWNWMPLDYDYEMPCHFCDHPIAIKDSMLCMSVNADTLCYGEVVKGNLGLSFVKLHRCDITTEMNEDKRFKYHFRAFNDSLSQAEMLDAEMIDMLNSLAYNDYLDAINAAAPNGFIDTWEWLIEDSLVTFKCQYMNLNEKTIKHMDIHFNLIDSESNVMLKGILKSDCDIAYMTSGELNWPKTTYKVEEEGLNMSIVKLVITYSDGTKKTLTGDMIKCN